MNTEHPIEQWLKATGKTKAQLAKDAGVSRMGIWRIMNGDKSLSIGLLTKVSAHTGIPVAKLIVERDE